MCPPENIKNNPDTDDLKNGEVYTILLNNIFPEDCDKSSLDKNDINQRMQKVLENAKNIGVDSAGTPEGEWERTSWQIICK